MLTLLFNLTFFSYLFYFVNCWKILIFNPRLSHSHVNYVGKIADILQEAGNNVTVIQQVQARKVSTIGSKKAKVIIIDGIDVEEELKLMKNDFDKNIWSSKGKNLFSVSKILKQVWSISKKQCKSLITNKELLKKLKNEKFDIGFAEKFSPCAFGIFNKINITTVISGAATGFGESFFEDHGLMYPTSYLPPIMGGENIPKGFKERLRNIITYYVSKYMYVDASILSIQQAFDEVYGSESPNIEKLSKKVAFIIVNSSPLLDFPHPKISKIIEIAGIEYNNYNKLNKLNKVSKINKLNNEWDIILNKRTKNVLLSFGSAIMSNEMPENIKKGIVETFKSFSNITFIWKYEDKNISFAGNCSNIIFKEWIPQIELLNDKRVDLFITHGGLNSVIELAHTKTPTIFIPLFSDQKRNAYMFTRYGTSKIFNKENLINSKKFINIIEEILKNNSYKEKAEKLSLMISKYPLNGKNTLIKSFDFAGSFGYVKEMDLPSINMSFIELYNIDIYIIISITFLLIFIIILKCIKYMFYMLSLNNNIIKYKKE
uniref:glucuronosyltransferase n=1 Tax=Strongyloides stercoralis TaxID=6248 RepID=A0A0K0ELT5_STRER